MKSGRSMNGFVCTWCSLYIDNNISLDVTFFQLNLVPFSRIWLTILLFLLYFILIIGFCRRTSLLSHTEFVFSDILCSFLSYFDLIYLIILGAEGYYDIWSHPVTHTHTRTHTQTHARSRAYCKYPLDEWSVLRRELYQW